MTSNEFVLWLKGFTEGVHEFNITPKQWDILKEKLAVEDKVLILESPKFPFGTPTGTTITTTPGVSSITITNPPFGFGSTSTAYGYPSGSAWCYTTSNKKIF